MFELIGLIFGGASRLGQHWLDLKDKQKEREHEAVMFDLQVKLQDQRLSAEKDMRQMDATVKREEAELDALVTALQTQAQEAGKAGGWVLKLSASVRPVVSYWLLLIYSASKVAGLHLALTSGASLAEAVRASYTEFDGTLLGTVIAFYFVNRSLAK